MTDRIPLDDLTSDQLDALYDQLDAAHRRIKTLEHVAAGNKRHVQAIVPDLERAEAALVRVHHLAAVIHAGAPWTANHTELAARIRTAAGPAPAAAEAPGYCPACGRGDCAPTPDEYEQQRQRADRAETAIARVRGLRERARTEAPASQGPTWEGLDLALNDTLPPAEQTTEK
ncbi:hypothetical protein [Streptomyces olivaceus]|uniref:hypothetical protein n=1 Tax=Streptomyces olivaceus TaxID=47716 RepID=UPI0004CB0123|nr:hypothetical protein [Streptomyces olivaceus]MBZ6102754.1 hypothetical protein [Streptomyces olivaceus]